MAITFTGATLGSAINGGNVTLTIPTSARAVNDCIIVGVTIGTSRTTPTLSVTTSGGTAFTKIVNDIASSNAHFAVFRRIIASTGETAATVTGTGNSSDSACAVMHIFDGVSTGTPEDVTPTSTTGESSTPDSPSITVANVQCAIITAIGLQALAAPVAPAGFLNALSSVNGNDNWDSDVGQAWITNNTTAAYNPASWSASAAFPWCSATIALRPSQPALTWASDFQLPPDLRVFEIVGY